MKYIIIALLLLVLLSIYVYKESTGFHVVKYCLNDRRINKNVKLVFISDLHNNEYGEGNIEVLDKIDEINPDYVVIGGDTMTSCMEKWTGLDKTFELVKKLTKKYKVIYGMGNHEERLRRLPERFPEGVYEQLVNGLKEAGAPLLVDECIRLDDEGIDIYGLDLEHAYFRKFVTKDFASDYLANKLGNPDRDRYSILLAHNPEHFKAYVSWGADLILSGHVHGGIIRLPFLGGVVSPAMKLFPKYDGGLFSQGNSHMVLSRGLGTHTIPVRINNKAELVVVELTNKA